MQRFTAAAANTLTADMVAIATGANITAGTVTGYLIADSGDNAGKWWDASGSTWSATEVSAGAMTFKSKSSWQVSIAAGAWDVGVKYTFYGTESGALNIQYSETVIEIGSAAGTGSSTLTYTLTTDPGGIPIADALVWVTTDIAGANTVASGRTDLLGVVVFYLDAGTYYLWRRKSGYDFTNPDTEVVA